MCARRRSRTSDRSRTWEEINDMVAESSVNRRRMQELVFFQIDRVLVGFVKIGVRFSVAILRCIKVRPGNRFAAIPFN